MGSKGDTTMWIIKVIFFIPGLLVALAKEQEAEMQKCEFG
jgi:hypothetical protein